MLSKWQKQNIVQGFLSCLVNENELHCTKDFDKTYQNMKDGYYGFVSFDNMYYTIHINSHVYQWSEH